MNDSTPFRSGRCHRRRELRSRPDGGRPLRFLREAGFKRPLYAVNKNGGEVQGLRLHEHLDIAGAVDHAIVCVPALRCGGVDECIRKGVRCIQVLTSGFAEPAPRPSAAGQIVAMCRPRARDGRPNPLGLLNVHRPARDVLDCSTAPSRCPGDRPRDPERRLRIVRLRHGDAAASASRIVATGNEADVDVAECIEYLAGDSDARDPRRARIVPRRRPLAAPC